MIKWGILGTSFISGVMADAIAQVAGHQVYAVAGRAVGNLSSFQQRHQAQKVFTDYQQLIDDPQVDIVYIALPNHIHHHYIIQAARAGKAILCEKSLSIDMAKTEAAIKEVKQHNVFFIEGLMYLHHPLARRLTTLISAGELGAIRSVTARYGADIAHLVNPDSRGAIYNLGCYPASLLHLVIRQCYGEAVSDYRMMANGRRGQDGNIAEAAALLTWPGRAQAHLHCVEDYGMFWDVSIQGSLATLRLESNPWLPTVTGNRLVITPYQGEARYEDIPAGGDAFYYQVEAIGQALHAGQTSIGWPAPSLDDSYQIMALLTEWEKLAAADCDSAVAR